ncbi:MAG: tripartite tricarboxylate transporter TctB family protein [Methyloligellaceae bacterium]
MGPYLRNSSLIVGTVAVVTGIGVLLLVPVQVPGETWAAVTDLQSPAFFPIVNGMFLTLCGAVLTLTAVFRHPDGAAADPIESVVYPGKLAATAGLLAVYLSVIPHIGMVVSSSLAIATMSILLGYRNKLLIPIVSIIFPIFIYFLFEKILKILLPHGVLF